MNQEALSTPLKNKEMKTIYDHLTKVTQNKWGVTFVDLDEFFGCGIIIDGITRMGTGDTIHDALVDSAKIWGIQLPQETPAEPELPTPPAPKVEAPPNINLTEGLNTPVKEKVVWTLDRKNRMQEVKSKLRMTDPAQLGIHIETWSKGKIRGFSDLTIDNVDEFIDYMFKKYINRIKEGGLDDPGAIDTPPTDESPF